MEAMREKWTDERLDDLNGHMSEGFNRLSEDLREVRSEIGGVRGEVSDLRGEVNELRGEMNTRFEATHRLIIQVGGGLFGTMVVGFLSLVVSLFLTQH